MTNNDRAAEAQRPTIFRRKRKIPVAWNGQSSAGSPNRISGPGSARNSGVLQARALTYPVPTAGDNISSGPAWRLILTSKGSEKLQNMAALVSCGVPA